MKLSEVDIAMKTTKSALSPFLDRSACCAGRGAVMLVDSALESRNRGLHRDELEVE